jgi:hypothetical protein
LSGHGQLSEQQFAAAAAAAAAEVLSDAPVESTAAATVPKSPARVTNSCQVRSRLLAYACTAADGLHSPASAPATQQCTTAQQNRQAVASGAMRAAGCMDAHSAAGAGLTLSCARGPASTARAAASSCQRPAVEVPHWRPVPPATQLMKPLLLKLM